MTNKHDHRKTYWKVWGGLIFLTILTVWTSMYDFGTMNIVVAIGIASLKASLVALFFMHLKYDNKVDKVTFVSSLLFLLIFIGLTASDMLDRGTVIPLKVNAVSSGGMDIGDINKLDKATPELIAQGKKVFMTNCVTCHGPEGKGNGPAAAAFNPPPRNFTSGEWKQGGKPSQIYQTITHGLNSMPSFAGLPPEQRWAVIHFIRTFSPNRPEDTPADITALENKAGAKKNTLPIRVAMDLVAVPETPGFAFKKTSTHIPGDSEGAQLYTGRCAQCHGANGHGGVQIQMLGSNPGVFLTTQNFTGSTAPWVSILSEFVRINTDGLPGFGKPGIADLTPAQWQSLYAYVRGLAGVH